VKACAIPSVRKNGGSTSNELTKPGYTLTWNVEITFFIKAPPEILQQILKKLYVKDTISVAGL